MRKFSVILFLLSVGFSAQSLNAQLLTEKLGGVSTNFLITSADTVNLQPVRQVILQRAATREYITDGYYQNTHQVGYNAYHLEFSSVRGISAQMVYNNKMGCFDQDFYRLVMYDVQEEVVGAMQLTSREVTKWINTNVVPYTFAFSIDLSDVPLVLLDNTARLDILQVHVRCE